MKTETEIYEHHLSAPCQKWLEDKGCIVQAEVMDLDLMGQFQSITIAIELKLRLNLDVILQAVERQRMVDYVYIAVPHNYKAIRSSKFNKTVCLLKRLNMGLITVNLRSNPPSISEILEAKEFDFQRSKNASKSKKAALIREFNSRRTQSNIGGVNKRKIMTAYREQALEITYHMRDGLPTNSRELVKKGASKAKTAAILRANYYGWYEKLDKSIYVISESGRNALIEFNDIVNHIVNHIVKQEGES